MSLRKVFMPFLFWTFAQVEAATGQDGPALYDQIVNTVMDIYLDGLSDEEISENLRNYYEENGYIRVNQCQTESLSHYSENSVATDEDPRLQVSYDIVQIELARLAFQLTGYPEELWQSELANLVSQTPNEQTSIFDQLEALTSRLEKYRLSANPGLPKLIVEACGGTDPLVAKITLEPPDGRVWLISEFDAKLCELDGLGISDCPRWQEQTGQEFIMVLGNYRLFAQWGDGTTYNGHRSFVSEIPSLDTFEPESLEGPLVGVGFNILIRR